MPENLSNENAFEHYCNYFQEHQIKSVYLQSSATSANIRFCEHNPQLTHVVLHKDLASIDCVRNLPNLQCLEILDTLWNVCPPGLLESLECLETLVVKRSNNFLQHHPKNTNLRELVLKNIVSFVKGQEFIESLPIHFPKLDLLVLYSIDRSQTFDLSPLQQYGNRFQWSKSVFNSTRISKSDGFDLVYIEDQAEIEAYIEDVIDEHTKSAFLQWENFHQDHLEDIYDSSPLIEHIHIYGSLRIDDLSILQKFDGLKELILSNCESIRNIQPLCDVRTLQKLTIKECNNIVDYSVLKDCNLDQLEIVGSGGGQLTDRVYKGQLFEIWDKSNIPEAGWLCDVPLDEIDNIFVERTDYLKLVAEELSVIA